MKFNPLDHPICFETPQLVAGSNAWVEHIPFAFFIIDIIKPKVLVELGTYAGNSYCAFCQAIQTLNLDTKAYAVDTWEGDEHGGFYDPEILTNLRAHHDPHYASFSRLMQMTFDNARDYFSDGTIDLLHIDGLHTYEAVKHDFENWQPKLSENAVVLFHDINVRERDFGVWKFWEELKTKYRYLEFFHGNGLGVLALNGSFPEVIEDQLNLDSGKSIRQFFSYLGGKYLFSIENNELQQLVNQKSNQYQQLVEENAALQTSAEAERIRYQQLVEENAALQTSAEEEVALQNEIIEAKAKIALLQSENAGLSTKVQLAQIDIDNLINKADKTLETIVIEKNNIIEHTRHAQQELINKIDDLEFKLTDKQHQIDELESTISKILLSKSWRITRPFRKAFGVQKGG